MHTYYDVKEMLHKELADIVNKGELSAGSLDTIDKLLESIKNSCKIIMYEEYSQDGYSYADGDRDMSEYSYARFGRGRGTNARRDSMGRYSSDGSYANARGRYSRRSGYSYDDGEGKEEKISMLREMMGEVSDDERRALQKIIRKMENE
jgi:hypothetical protein